PPPPPPPARPPPTPPPPPPPGRAGGAAPNATEPTRPVSAAKYAGTGTRLSFVTSNNLKRGMNTFIRNTIAHGGARVNTRDI
ncbi:MAG: hypothetical protein LBL45_08740, partial [Treponema sp.]|nr:hypothetical protein [Treponema sp.]